MITKFELDIYLRELLNTKEIVDPFCTNGMQIEGKENINKIVTGVSANLAFIKAAIKEKADCMIVHHGVFWRSEEQRIIGIQYKRISSIIKHNLNLFAYHLPLDVHWVFGNNIKLAQLLELEVCGSLVTNTNPDYGIICRKKDISFNYFINMISTKLNRKPTVIGRTNKRDLKIAICTGAGQKFIDQAVASGADIYISGEISEKTTHIAKENDIVYIAAGHHATERYGIQALGEHLEQKYNLQHLFIEIDNPA